MFGDARFLKVFAVAVVLHTLWDSDRLFLIPQDEQHIWMSLVKDVVLGLIGWYVVFTLVQSGLKQVKQEQQRASKEFMRATAA
jgi:RsiW-degrading membrane proteinase PrsW (M82 family)